MKLKLLSSLSLFSLVVIVWSSCSSGKSAYEHGNYYDAVITAVNRLRRNTDNKKSSETLRSAYPMAVRYYEDRVNAAMSSNAEFKWREVVQHYNTLQSMYNEIQRSPGALQVIPNPTNYQAKITDAKQKAAEESYQAGILALGTGDRANAKKAYYLFVNANEYVPGYKDVASKIEEARWAAIIKVAVDPIPVASKNYALDANYFDNKLNEFLRNNQTNEFVRYFKSADAQAQKIIPDHIVQLSFEEFSIGQVYVNEKESQMERDSIVVAYTFPDTKGQLTQQQTEAPKLVPAATMSTDVKNASTVKQEEKKTADNQSSTSVSTTTSGSINTTSNSNTSSNTNTSTGTNTSANTNSSDNKSDSSNQSANGQTSTSENNSKQSDEKQGADQQGKNSENQNETKSDAKENDGKQEEQVTICHQPPGKPSERKSLVVPKSAVNAHLKHGDVLGECKTEKSEDKGKGNSKDGGAGMASLMTTHGQPVLLASASGDQHWYLFENADVDTTKIYGKVKATVRQFKKTITSRGVLNFRIVDARTNAVISEQRMPSEYVWTSEWLTYNGDSRALTPEQSKLATQRELPPPTNQDLFAEFTKPLFDQIATKITEFYKGY